jgi:dihydrofolate synthase / folylpolyglutamate synthase
MDEHSDILNKLYGLQNVGIKLGLDRTYKLFKLLGNPQNNLKFIHVAGTNGKGSVCATVAKALENVGYKVGFYSSPHLISLRERFRINGKGIEWNELEELINEIWPTVQNMRENEEYITFFEVTVALAAKYFEKNRCDFVLWETGLGGRLDSTNIVTPIITAITGIGLDHEAFLGDTEEKIAAEKAGIIKKDIPIFVGDMKPEAFDVIYDVAKEKGVELVAAMKDVSLSISRKLKKKQLLSGWEFSINSNTENKYFLPLPGKVQPNNLKLSYLILEYMSEKYSFSLDKALKGIEQLKWPGRIQLLPDGKILDGAHNPQGIQEFVNTVESCYPNVKFKIIFGCLAEREPENALKLLSKIADEFIFVPIESTRPCFSPDEILDIAKMLAPNIPVRVEKNSETALNYVKDSKTAIVGSLYLAGEILKSYYNIDEIVDI